MAPSIEKLESPKRLAELDPANTLKKAGLKTPMTVLDIGAGTGVFAIPAASLTTGCVYAVDLNADMLAVLREKVTSANVENIAILHCDAAHIPLEAETIDMVVLVTVLHEIENPADFVGDLRTYLKDDGRVMVVEFVDRPTPMGPSVDERIGSSALQALFEEKGYALDKSFSLGENLYTSVFTLPKKSKLLDIARVGEYIKGVQGARGACPATCDAPPPA